MGERVQIAAEFIKLILLLKKMLLRRVILNKIWQYFVIPPTGSGQVKWRPLFRGSVAYNFKEICNGNKMLVVNDVSGFPNRKEKETGMLFLNCPEKSSDGFCKSCLVDFIGKVIFTMGKGRGKGKKQSVITKREEHGNEDKDSDYRQSGMQQKSQKDEIEEVEEASGNVQDGENMKAINSSTENKRKRKRSVLVKEKTDPVKEENAIRTKRNPNEDSKKPAGFRQSSRRRKNKPRRAAEAGVDCSLPSEIFV